jgi:hypothetical protein
MAQEPDGEKSSHDPTLLSRGWFITLVLEMFVAIPMIEAAALDLGASLGGDAGRWLGIAINHLVTSVLYSAVFFEPIVGRVRCGRCTWRGYCAVYS